MYEFVLSELEASKPRWREIAEEIDMSLSTIRKIARKEVENPGVHYIEKLASYFRAQAAA